MVSIKYSLVALASLALLPLFMISTNPNDLPLILLMLPAVLVFVSGYLITYVTLTLLKYPVTSKKIKIMALASAALPTLLLVLQTLQQLLLRDILIVGSLWLLVMWYLQRIDFA